jgi:hypothetical protein
VLAGVDACLIMTPILSMLEAVLGFSSNSHILHARL